MLRWRRTALACQLSVLTIVLLFGLLPGGSWLAVPLEERFAANPALPDRVDGIIVLGGTERISLSAARRRPVFSDATPILEFLKLGERFPAAKMVFSGGAHPRNAPSPTEADIVHDFIRELGRDDAQVIYEARSQNTLENARLSRELVHPAAAERWILITQPISMPRAVGVFRQAGWNVIPFPAGYLTNPESRGTLSFNLFGQLRLASLALHEWGGLVVYWWTGYTSEFFPR